MYKIGKRLGLLKTFDTVEETWLAESAGLSGIQSVNYYVTSGFFKGVLGTRFASIELKIGSLESEKNVSVQVHTGYLTISLKKTP